MARTTDPDIRLLQAAADPVRLRMLRQLALGPVCACDFTADSKVSQPTVSHHLRVLRDAGWVTTERRGTWIWYSVNPEAVERLRALGAGLDPEPAIAGAQHGRGVRLPVVEANPR